MCVQQLHVEWSSDVECACMEIGTLNSTLYRQVALDYCCNWPAFVQLLGGPVRLAAAVAS